MYNQNQICSKALYTQVSYLSLMSIRKAIKINKIRIRPFPPSHDDDSLLSLVHPFPSLDVRFKVVEECCVMLVPSARFVYDTHKVNKYSVRATEETTDDDATDSRTHSHASANERDRVRVLCCGWVFFFCLPFYNFIPPSPTATAT